MSRNDGNYAILWVCMCCLFAREGDGCGCEDNGITHENEPWSKLADGEHMMISHGLYAEDHADTCTDEDRVEGCDCERNTFSTAQCDGCGSYLHGEREAYTLTFPAVPSPADADVPS